MDLDQGIEFMSSYRIKRHRTENKPTKNPLKIPLFTRLFLPTLPLILLPTSQYLQMTRLLRQTALRLQNQSRRKFLYPLAVNILQSPSANAPYSTWPVVPTPPS